MKQTKKQARATVASLRAKSENAISAFKNLISGLKTTNEEADAVKAANSEQIEALKQENAAIDLLTSQNAKIIQNIETLLQ